MYYTRNGLAEKRYSYVLVDIVNGLMAFPNFIALLALRKVVTVETRQYFEKLKLKNHELKKPE